jgi:hypothetical protein
LSFLFGVGMAIWKAKSARCKELRTRVELSRSNAAISGLAGYFIVRNGMRQSPGALSPDKVSMEPFRFVDGYLVATKILEAARVDVPRLKSGADWPSCGMKDFSSVLDVSKAGLAYFT